MRKTIYILVAVLVVFGSAVNAYVSYQVNKGIVVTDLYLHCTHCLQTVIWILFSLVCGVEILLNQDLLIDWLEKVLPNRNSEATVLFGGVFLLAQTLLAAYSLTNDCQIACIVK